MGTNHGKFSLPNFPHKGWVCVADAELPEGYTQICAACEKQHIKYVFTVEHDEWPERLDVGVDCHNYMLDADAKHDGQKRSQQKQRLKKIADKWLVINGGTFAITHKRQTAHIWRDGAAWTLGLNAQVKPHPISAIKRTVYEDQRQFATLEDAVDELKNELGI